MDVPSSGRTSSAHTTGGHTSGATLRRHALGSANARGLLLTVFGEYVLPSGAPAWTSACIEVLGRLGVEPGTTRQALSRTASAGWIASQRKGRQTRWHLTEAGMRLLTEGTERIYGFSGPDDAWDGRWLVLLASVPEADRAARHRLRTRLTWAGMGSPAPGVWVGTRADRLAEVEGVLARAGVAGTQLWVGAHAWQDRVAAMVSETWDLPGIEEEYERFLAEFAGPDAADPLARVVELVHAWRRFPWRDPGLPRELLPDGWKGAEAAELFRRRHEAWTKEATEAWAALNPAAG